MLSSVDFLAIFPEFTGNTQIPTALTVTYAMNCGYLGLDEAIRPYAMALSVASYLVANGDPVAAMTALAANPTIGSALGAQAISEYQSHEDTIKFFTPRGKKTSDYTNHYQRVLNEMIDNGYMGAISVPGYCGGCH